jgi:polyvinyl alcohol dehydrogenase (cytochrome)
VSRACLARWAALGALAGAVLAAALVGAGSGSSAGPAGPLPGPFDWPSYGHDPQHSFHGDTTLDRASAARLAQAWFFPTGDAVTATPTVVDGVVYVGSWDDYFYALDLRSGALRWRYRLHPQPAVAPQPGQVPRQVTSDGGMVTSSAWFEPAAGRRPPLVIFGGGYTLYALDARTGRPYWTHAYTGRPDRPPDPQSDDTRIFSSPVVVDGKVLFGVSVDGARGRRGYVVAASVATGRPVWEYQTDADGLGRVLDDGCGSVWSSGTVLASAGLVVFDTSDCHFANPPPLSESVLALRIADGRLAWSFRPARVDQRCDYDFGATPNAGLGPGGRARFLGVGGKDGTYYSLDPATGALRWATRVVFGGFSGGFIGTTAYDGRAVYGATALGDYGRFEHGQTLTCEPGNPADAPMQEPSVHAFDARSGQVLWQADQGASFGPTTVAGGLTVSGVALRDEVDVRDAATGSLVARLPTRAPCWSGVATVGDALVLGTGASQQGHPDGVYAFTPGGRPPSVPGR